MRPELLAFLFSAPALAAAPEEVRIPGQPVVLGAVPETSWCESPVHVLSEGAEVDLGQARLRLERDTVLVSGTFQIAKKVKKFDRPHTPHAFLPRDAKARPTKLQSSALKKGIYLEIPVMEGTNDTTILRVGRDWRGVTWGVVNGWRFELEAEALTVVDSDRSGAPSGDDTWIYGERTVGMPPHDVGVSGETIYRDPRFSEQLEWVAEITRQASPGVDADEVRRWNETRKDHGVPPGIYDATRAEHCRLHARYLITNNTRGHDEDPSLPGYTDEGRRAGMSSCITFSGRDGAVARFTRSLYHRSQLIDPRDTTLQFGGEGGTFLLGGLYGPATPGTGRRRLDHPQLFPAPGSKMPDGSYRSEHPRHPAYDRSSSLGLPVTCRFGRRNVPVPSEAKLYRVRGKLVDGKRDEEIPTHLCYPGHDSAPGFDHNWEMVALTPLQLLSKGAYEVEFRFENGSHHLWRFEIGR